MDKYLRKVYETPSNYKELIEKGICINDAVLNYETIGCMEDCEKCYKTAFEENMGGENNE